MAQLSLMARLGLDGSGYFLGMKRAEGSAKNLSHEFNSNLKGAIAGAFGTFALIEYTKKTIEFASHLNDLSDRTDVSTDALQEWGFAAKQNGSNIDEVVSFFEKLGAAREKALGGSQQDIAWFKKLGVATDDLKKKRLEGIGLQVGKTIQNGDVQNLIGALKGVGGKGAGALVPTFKSDLEEMAKAAREAGAIMKLETIEKLDAFGDELDVLAMRLRGPFADAITSVLRAGNIMVTGVKAIMAYLGQAAGDGKSTPRKIIDVIGAMSPLGVAARMFTPLRDDSITRKKEDPFEAFKKVFSDAAEQEISDQQEIERRRKLRLEARTAATSSLGHSEKMSVTAREQIGAYISGANPLLQTAQRSEKHLESIKKALLQKNVGGFQNSEDIYA